MGRDYLSSMALIRTVFQDELDGVSQTLQEMSEMVILAISSATDAILTANLELAQEVIKSDDLIDSVQHELDDRIIEIIARQQPVATDLRALVTALRISSDLERMGDMAHHIAKTARLRHPKVSVPAETTEIISHMGTVAKNMAQKMTQVIVTRSTDLSLEVEKDDDQMDDLHRKLISKILEMKWESGVEGAVDLTLLGRHFERYADHAVSVARRINFLVTGSYR
jgi:phosphate transport system protein